MSSAMPQDAVALRAILTLAPVIPVIILDDIGAARPMAEALVAGGLPILEVTLRTKNALRVMDEMAKVKAPSSAPGPCAMPNRCGSRSMSGASSWCRLARRRACSMRPTISPSAAAGDRYADRGDAAAERGYTFLSLSGGSAGGAPVLKAFASPLPDITFCPTGGIDLEKAKIYLALPNVICVGGSWIVRRTPLRRGISGGSKSWHAKRQV